MKEIKKIYLTMMEYSLDYYEEKHMEQTAPAYEPYMMEDYGEGRLFLTEKRYWPKDEKIQKEMEAATEKAEQLNKGNKNEGSHFFSDYEQIFEYGFGSEKWIKYFFDKSPGIRKKYKGYKVKIFLNFEPIITGISGLSEYQDLNWIVE